jgi:DNA-binding transcriptional LysR family regulator
MQYKQLEALIYVARKGTFKQAAEDLYFDSPGEDYITPESIQYRIKQLEQELGVSLYQKRQGSARVQLTREGKVFLREALEIYQRMSHWRNMFAESDKSRLTIAATQAVIIHRLLDTVAEFRKKFPTTRLRMLNASAEQAEALVLEGETDFAFSTRKPDRAELTYILWKKSRMVALVPPQHALSRQKALKLTDLTGEPLILLEPDLRGDRDLIDTSMHRAGLSKPNIALEVSNSEIISAYVESGLGVGIIAETSMEKQRRKVVAIPILDIPEKSEVGLLVRTGQYLPHRTREFLTMLDPIFGEWLKEHDIQESRQEEEEPEPKKRRKETV